MGNLIKIILAIFQAHMMNVCVIENNHSYTYRDILSKAANLAEILNKLSDQKLRIGLMAKNSTEWIIVFLGVLLSKHKLILFYSEDITKIRHVSANAMLAILFTDHKPITSIEIPYCSVYPIRSTIRIIDTKDFDIDEFLQSDNVRNRMSEEEVSIAVYTPRRLSKVRIDGDTIVDTLKVISLKDTFVDANNYIAEVDFTYNYIVGFLLPLQYGVTFVIPNDSDVYGRIETYMNQEPEVVIMNARQFEKLYQEGVEHFSDNMISFLKLFRLWFLRKRLLKSRLEKIFPKTSTLIILNSTLDINIERTIAKLGVPYITTFGRVEDCGITTFSTPTDFIPMSIGEFIMGSGKILELEEEDFIKQYINDKNKIVLQFHWRRDDEIHTELNLIVAQIVESSFRQLAVVDDCILCQIDGQLILKVLPDLEHSEYIGLDFDGISEMLQQHNAILCEQTNTWEQISEIQIVLKDFYRDSYGRVQKHYYQGESLS